MHSVYGIAPRIEVIEWKDLKYIGISQDILARFAQHVACLDDSHEEKNLWMQGEIMEGRMPLLCLLEGDLESVVHARTREQELIRYAMAQGAVLFNRQITYIGDEQAQAAEERAKRYAAYLVRRAELNSQGIYVKHFRR